MPFLSQIFLVIYCFFLPPESSAAPFMAYDARSMGMGGAGVAMGDSANAALINPALLGLRARQEKFSFELPAANVMLSDPGNFRGAWEEYQKNRYDRQLNDAVLSFNNEVQSQYTSGIYDYYKLAPIRDDIVNICRTLLNLLERGSGRWIGAQGNLAGVVGVPDPNYGASLFWNTWGVGGALINITRADVTLINELLNTAAAIDPTNYSTLVAAATALADPSDKLYSSLQGRYSVVQEYGFALARQTHWMGEDVAIGFSPKVLNVTMYDYKYVVRDLHLFRWEPAQWKNQQSGVNADAGIAARFRDRFYFGLVVKNLQRQQYLTRLNNSIDVLPQWRFGLGFQNGWWAYAADMDLVVNAPASLEPRSQYTGIGIEWRYFSWLALRAGWRHDWVSNLNLATAGFGLKFWILHLEAAVAGNENELGGSIQLGMMF